LNQLSKGRVEQTPSVSERKRWSELDKQQRIDECLKSAQSQNDNLWAQTCKRDICSNRGLSVNSESCLNAVMAQGGLHCFLGTIREAQIYKLLEDEKKLCIERFN
jgi:hypothetical protein